MFGEAHDIIELLKLNYLARCYFSLPAIAFFTRIAYKMS
jgi:hypothetical protein